MPEIDDGFTTPVYPLIMVGRLSTLAYSCFSDAILPDSASSHTSQLQPDVSELEQIEVPNVHQMFLEWESDLK